MNLLSRFHIYLLLSFSTLVNLQAEEGFTSLFNGRDLTGWKVPEPNPFFSVKDGAIVVTNDAKLSGAMLYTQEQYSDFVFETDVRWQGEVDTGVMIRKPEIQMQLGTSRSLKRDMSGSFYIGNYPEAGQAKQSDKLFKSGEWNTFRLQAKGTTFTVWINGQQAVEYNNDKYKNPGPIGLQVHPKLAMTAEYRNLRVKKLD